MGAANVVITLKTGCYALLRSSRSRDRLYRAWIPAGRVGGDRRIGRLASGRLPVRRSRPSAPHEEFLRLALGCGAANTQEVGAGVFDPRDVGAVRGRGGGAGDRAAPREGVLTRC